MSLPDQISLRFGIPCFLVKGILFIFKDLVNAQVFEQSLFLFFEIYMWRINCRILQIAISIISRLVSTLRSALDGEKVSETLHSWIDLVRVLPNFFIKKKINFIGKNISSFFRSLATSKGGRRRRRRTTCSTTSATKVDELFDFFKSIFGEFQSFIFSGSVDLDSITKLEDRYALEVQIGEFGQVNDYYSLYMIPEFF